MHEFKITTMTPELLKERFPEVHKAIYDEGMAHGKISGRDEGERIGMEQGIRYGKATAQPVTLPLTAVQETANFEMLARDYMREHKVSLGRAMITCAKLHPTEHLEFIKVTNSR